MRVVHLDGMGRGAVSHCGEAGYGADTSADYCGATIGARSLHHSLDRGGRFLARASDPDRQIVEQEIARSIENFSRQIAGSERVQKFDQFARVFFHSEPFTLVSFRGARNLRRSTMTRSLF